MSAGSAASNLGYGNISPYNNSPYVNGTSSTYSGSFSSNEIPGTPPGPLPGLGGAKYNVDAAAGKVPGICMNGGGKKLKRKIKNITKHYKRMRAGSKKIRSIRNRLKNRVMSRSFARQFAGRKRTRRNTRKYRKQRGGYSQYQNNLPMTPVFSVGSPNLPPNLSALANPPPITRLSNCVNCVDNYNHYTNMGFPSKGH
jgi:hypothetical protein